MGEKYKAIKVTDRVYWVGAVDWGVRDFHGYMTQRGSTYNAYLILADKVTLIDTVKKPFMNEMLERIASLTEPKNIEYIISNHSEPDHSGCLPETIDVLKPEKVFASTIGTQTLLQEFHSGHEIIPVKDGESLSLGNLNVTFFETKMLHWPDSMVTYMPDDKLLFSQDAFGMHLATSERFADEIDWSIVEYEGEKYFANIIMPLSSVVLRTLGKISDLGIEIDIIAPDHGPIWRKDVEKIINLYTKWATQKPTNKAVIVYDTMWCSTEKMAKVIAEGLIDGGVSTKIMSLKSNHRSDVITEILSAGAILVGSPTINSNMFPSVADLLYYLKGLRPQNKIGGVFGSYGWSGEAVAHIKEILTAMKVDLIGDGLRFKYMPNDNDLTQCFNYGKLIAEELKKRLD
ncbi:TPA: FprA family A-type flavoprotein [Candidatus Poribacteria bacterium]|nr:FprA family A-type flavoprotein [Candidatus Poribacteria bacterium]